MQSEQCDCPECGKEFSVQLIGGEFPVGKESEQVVCPYCYSVVRSEMTNGIFLTSKLKS